MFARLRLALLSGAALLVMPAMAAAQDARTSAQRVLSAPTIAASATALRRVAEPAPPVDASAALLQQRRSMGKPVALMVVGGAAIVVGAVMDNDAGDLFMVGGAVALLVGLYQYMK